jgi:ribose transport system ATP-binding protein
LPVVRLQGLTKIFAGTAVLENVDLTVMKGEIHGLVGQNGSGKSTLIKLLCGLYTADRGTVVVDGDHELSSPPGPAELRRHGLAFVHQDLGLVGEMSVAENICVGQYDPGRFTRIIDWRRERAAVRRTLDRLGATIDPGRPASTLHPGEKALVAIARGLHNGSHGEGCIVFDESTQSLPRDLLPDFYRTVREIAKTGTAVLIVSHQLGEVLELADRVSVLQDGRLIAHARSTAEFSESQLAALVLGRELDPDVIDRSYTAAAGRSRGKALRATHVTTETLSSVDIAISPGEVVGVTGQTGAGHDQLPYALSGAIPATGDIEIGDRSFSLAGLGASALQRAGIAFVPQDRTRAGLAVDLTAMENLTLPRVTKRRGLLLSDWQTREYDEATEQLGIVPHRPRMPVTKFSGGNQQKLLLAKWLLNEPDALLMHEPTQAVDVGARLEILRVIRATANRGVSVLVSSIETQDLALICDRVVIFDRGRNANRWRNRGRRISPRH